MNKETKTPRASQTRSKTERPKVWAPPSSLDAPKAKDGFHHRWIRESTMGYDDTKNLQGRLRTGYELVRADEYPDGEYPTVKDGKYAGVIGHGGLVLARVPIEIVDSRNEYFANKTRESNEALEHDLKSNERPGMKIYQDRNSSQTFGGTKKD